MTHADRDDSRTKGSERGTALALLVAAAFFMENLDGTVIATAIPAMAKSFGVAPVDLNVGITAYLLTLGVFIPISGWAADRFGARRVFSIAVIVFTLASLGCGLARGVNEFVAVRILQGIGGAMMVPVGRLVVLKSTPKEHLISAIATLTWPALVAPILGPPVGGLITTYADWPWIFYLNIPLGIVTLAATFVLMPRLEPPARRPFDWLGFLLIGSSLFCLTWAVESTGRQDSGWRGVAIFAGAGAVLGLAAIRYLRRAAHPVLSFAALDIRTFTATILGGSLFRMAITAVPFLLPLMFQLGFGLDAFHAGLMLIAVFAGNLLMKPMTTPVLRRFGFRQVMIVNGVLGVATLAACALIGPRTPAPVSLAILFLGGMSRSMQFTCFNTLAFADVPQDRMNGANTLFSTAFQLSLGFGVAAGAVALRIGEAMSGAGVLPGGAAAPYHFAFLAIAGLAALSLVDCVRLDADAGAGLVQKG